MTSTLAALRRSRLTTNSLVLGLFWVMSFSGCGRTNDGTSASNDGGSGVVNGVNGGSGGNSGSGATGGTGAGLGSGGTPGTGGTAGSGGIAATTGGGSGTGGTTGGRLGAAGAAGASGDDEGCWSTYRESHDPSPMFSQRYSYDDETRILTVSREYESPDVPTPSPVYYRLDEAGWLITYATDDHRQDYERDEHHNVVHYEYVNETWTDLTEPATRDPSGSYDATHTYTSDGELETTIDGDTTISFSHDEQGRCTGFVRDTDPPTSESYTYREGRLETITNVSRGIPDSAGVRNIVRTLSYDDEGRVVAIEQDGGGYYASSSDGTPDIMQYWAYEPDGSYSVDTRDCATDVVTEMIDGRWCYRSVTTFSAGCIELSEEIPIADSLACHFGSSQGIPLWPRRFP